VAGGSPGASVGATAERYDPATDTWAQTGNLVIGRSGFTLTALLDGGALATGGASAAGLQASAETFDPATSSWTQRGSMATPRMNHSATRLGDGRVLVAGGVTNNGGATNEVEIYDPASGAWRRADPLHNPRYNHTATLLADGRVLVVGGFTPGSNHTPTKKAELYDPATDRWTVVDSMRLARGVHGALRLADGRVLVVGGVTSPPNALVVTATAEIFDPASASWSATGSMGLGRRAIDLVLAPDGSVLVAGGFDAANGLTASAERFDPSTGAWSPAPALGTPRAPVLVRLLDGRVLAIASIGRLSTTIVEVFEP
jgi:hypothetical protein